MRIVICELQTSNIFPFSFYNFDDAIDLHAVLYSKRFKGRALTIVY